MTNAAEERADLSHDDEPGPAAPPLDASTLFDYLEQARQQAEGRGDDDAVEERTPEPPPEPRPQPRMAIVPRSEPGIEEPSAEVDAPTPEAARAESPEIEPAPEPPVSQAPPLDLSAEPMPESAASEFDAPLGEPEAVEEIAATP